MQINDLTKTSIMTDIKSNNSKQNSEKIDQKFNNFMDEVEINNETDADIDEIGEKMTEIIEDIDELKKKLEQKLTLKNLEEYKNYVAQFVEYYNENEMEIREEKVKNNRTYSEKTYTIIDSINEKVGEMKEELLKTNRGHLELLSKMGEINGLIINLLI